jgi:ABC-type sugar transport system ATPase subunit
MATVTYDKASRIFPGSTRPAVDALDLQIGDGEFLVLVGPSGCGKSTSLRMLAGLEDVDQGAVYIDQRDVTDLPPKARDIAMVFQNYALYPHMSVYDNMAFALKLRKTARPTSTGGCRRRRGCCSWSSSSSASRRRCPAASASGWRWAGRSSASRRSS